MVEILIGTSGYSYDEWVGLVYPEGTKQKDYLSCYSGLFPTVELNFSYYKMPKAQSLAKMLADSGHDLTFSIKAHKTLTHEINLSQWEEDAKTFLTAIEPVLEAGRLEAVLLQFPYSFHYTGDNRRYLDRLLKFFKGVPVAVEFRTADWCTSKVIEGMKNREMPLVSLDLPELPKLPPAMDVVTAPLAYIRMHGRNKEAWWGPDGYARYDYSYSDSEIEEWAARIGKIAEQTRRIVVYFNNHPLGNAAKNAQTLIKILTKIGLLTDRGRANHSQLKSLPLPPPS
jgi:uncharacterized protein YecE (DUF72 family)